MTYSFLVKCVLHGSRMMHNCNSIHTEAHKPLCKSSHKCTCVTDTASGHILSDSLLASLKYALSSNSAIKLSFFQQMSWKWWCVCSAAHNPKPIKTFAGQPVIKVLFQVIAMYQDGLIAEMWHIYSEVCGLLKWKTFVLAFCLGWYPSYRWSVFAESWVNIMFFIRGKPSPTQAVALFKFPNRRCVHKQLHVH